MAIGLNRKIRLDSRRVRQKVIRRKNSAIKRDERSRRAERMIARAKATAVGVPYAPEVASWLAAQLGRPYTRASADEIKAVLG